jgi:putative acyl-CoA dehydrogenase
LACGANSHFDAHLQRVKASLATLDQFMARRLVEDLALALQASLLIRHAPAYVADAYCATRLGGEGGRAYGTLPAGVDAAAIIDRAYPA